MTKINTEFHTKELVFHFNKKHLIDPDIPMWVVKAKGKTYYVNHVSSEIGWSTKEAPNSSHTKGSIKFKDLILQIDDESNATFLKPTPEALANINKKNSARISISGSFNREKVEEFLKKNAIDYSTPYVYSAVCRSYFMFDILDDRDLTLFTLGLGPINHFIVAPNTELYKMYDKMVADKSDYDEEEDEYILDDDDE